MESAKERQRLETSDAQLRARLASQDASIKQLRLLEESFTNQQVVFQERLDQVNQRLEECQGQLTEKDQNRSSPSTEIEARIRPLHEQLLKKDDECSLVRRELSELNSAKAILEAAKSKAGVEIHGLLRRVQESESWMKGIKDALEKLNIDPSKEPFWDTWNKLEALRKYIKNPTRPNSSSQHNPASPSQIVKRTEFIYRTQSVQPGSHSPMSRAANTDTREQTQTGMGIVPFSDFQKQLPLKEDELQKEDMGALSELLMTSTDGGQHGSTLGIDETHAYKDFSGTKPIAEAPTTRPNSRKRRVGHLQNGDTGGMENGTPKAPRQIAPRPIRRTYSRNRHGPTITKASSPAVSRVIAGSPYDRSSKRAKVSTASCSKLRRETSISSTYFESKQSPLAGQASENKNPSGRGSSITRQGGPKKRPGRKSRGKVLLVLRDKRSDAN